MCNKIHNSQKYTKLCRSCYTTYNHKLRKQQAIDYLGSKCKICGYNKCAAALEFHHNTKIKNFEITKAINHGMS